MLLHFEQLVPAPVQEVFAFHENPDNLSALLRTWGRFRMLQHDGPVRVGGMMWIEERFFGIPVAMAFRYHICEPPRRIGGQLIHGPFERFVHVHEFEPAPGGTRVRDTLDLCVPRRFGGDLTLRRLIAPMLMRAFRCRQVELLRLIRAKRPGNAIGQINLHRVEPCGA